MRFIRRIGWVLCWVLVAGMAMLAQAPAATQKAAGPGAVREIDDPHLGERWLLVKDAEHPGGPGRLVPLGPGVHGLRTLTGSAELVEAPVIHAGDRIVVEKHTERLDAVLEAVALGSAVEQGWFHARLRIGGRVVPVVAVRAGHAMLPAVAEAKP
ncbi:hypothetical protein [Occallatibacter riparius]|uniref:Flagella basal body P-ring formation protein FlgA C-terminal domain-containing protein n=1 Tax=Occallatibacter riparius TaxID=1002689 RepID=A0A9J7BP71_9BACT|nr:hypothetical protein [Occallatibacter riparius]UWZ82933.1 hypothetical protein MOP44_20470 [Occallatibacter riparius]